MFDRCLYFNVNALARQVNTLWEAAFAEFGLSPAHAYLLRLVLEQPGIAQREIATELKLEKSTVTRFIDALEKKDYLRRTRSGREQTIFPTDLSRDIARRLNNTGEALYRNMTQKLGEDSLTRLVSQLRDTGSLLKK